MAGRLDLALSILNGAVGDHLARTKNGLATEMALYPSCSKGGAPITAPTTALGTKRVALFVHGLMATETIWRFPDGSDYGSMLARDCGLEPLFVRYNTGQSILENGRQLAALLDALFTAHPLDELVLVGHSMGGLVARAACHVAHEQHLGWLRSVRRAFYIGTPHLGSPVERAWKIVGKILQAIPDPYTRLIADIADARSVGIKDLGDGAHPVPLLPQIEHHVIAGSVWTHPRLALLFGDILVPVASATSGRVTDLPAMELPQERVHVLRGVSHNELAHNADVYELLRTWLS